MVVSGVVIELVSLLGKDGCLSYLGQDRTGRRGEEILTYHIPLALILPLPSPQMLCGSSFYCVCIRH